jgi:2-phospho-L-lactate guanylyltransferase
VTGWIVLPIKSPEMCKTRLSNVLNDEARQRLVAEMLGHVLGVVSSIEGAEVLLLGPSRHGQPDSVPLLPDAGNDLNEALASAMRAALAAGVGRVTFISADLPFLTRGDLETLFDVPVDSMAIAADRWGVGTNALSLPLPHAAALRFCYGAESFARHRAEAERTGLDAREIRTLGFGFDVDTPADLTVLHSKKFR